MKTDSKFFGQTILLIIMIIIATLTAFELLITINAGIWADYPIWMTCVVTGFIISTFYLVGFFRKILAS